MGAQKVAQTTQVEPSLTAVQTGPTVDAVEPTGVSEKTLLSVRLGNRLASGGPPPPNGGLSDAGLAHPTATRQRAALARTLQRQRGNAFVQRVVLGRGDASGDTYEREADRFAELISGDGGRERLHLSRTGLAVQRSPNEGGTAPSPPAPTTSSPTPSPAKTALIVEDSATELEPGQMRKSEFLAQLRAAVCRTVEEVLAGTIWSVVGCPYLAKWFRYYGGRSGAQVEQAIRKYAPGATGVSKAQDVIPLICARVRAGVIVWREGGEVTGVPEDLPAEPSAGEAAAVPGDGGRVQLKSRDGHTREAGAPHAIQSQLGAGHPLESGVRSRMESVFGAGFGHVRVHTDDTAGRLSSDLNARAFTIGHDVAFGRSEYQPGTPVGDALIAHELAHTVQQGGAAEVSTLQPEPAGGVLEMDADRSAVGAVAALWSGARGRLGEIARSAMPRLRSGLRLQRCTEVHYDPRFSMEPTVTPADEKMLDALKGRHQLYDAYKAYFAAKGNLGLAEAAKSGARQDQRATAMEHHDITIRTTKARLDRELAAEGFANIEEFKTLVHGFEDFFSVYMVQTAFQMLRENEKLILSEMARYGSEAKKPDTKELRCVIRPIQDKVNQARKLYSDTVRSGPRERRVNPISKAKADGLMAEARKIAKGLAHRFPVLGDPDLNLNALTTSNEEQLKALLRGTASDRLDTIGISRLNLYNDPGVVWQLDGVVKRARRSLGIVQGSVYDAIIRHRQGKIKIDKEIKDAVLAGLAIGIAVATAGAGTVIGLLGTAAGLGIGAYQTAEHVKEFLVKEAAAGTAFDRAKALASEDPSVFWLAVDIAGLVTDTVAMGIAFGVLKKTAKAVAHGAASIDDLRRAATKVGNDLAKSKEIGSAEEFAESVVEAAKARPKRAAAAKPETLAAIRKAAPDLDDAATDGILRLSDDARKTLLNEFAGNKEVLERIGHMSATSKDTISAVDLLSRNMSDMQFKAVMRHYLTLRTARGRDFLRQIGEAGLSAEDIKKIAATMERVTSERGVMRKFSPAARDLVKTRLFEKGLRELRIKHPCLGGLDDGAIARILGEAPEVHKMKGQLLEELLATRVPAMLLDEAGKARLGVKGVKGPVEFIPEHSIRLVGKQKEKFTDGMIVVRDPAKKEMRVFVVFEAKAGKPSSIGLSRTYSTYDKEFGQVRRIIAQDVRESAALREIFFKRHRGTLQTHFPGKYDTAGKLKSISDSEVAQILPTKDDVKAAAKEFGITITEYRGQISRDIERAYEEGGAVVRIKERRPVEEMVEGEKKIVEREVEEEWKVIISPTKTRMVGVLPRDVHAKMASKLEQEVRAEQGIRFTTMAADAPEPALYRAAAALNRLKEETKAVK